MQPLLQPDDQIFVEAYHDVSRIQDGDIVTARHPNSPDIYIVKQVTRVDINRQTCYLDGVSSGNDSHEIGLIDLRLISGRVTAIIK